MSQNRPKIGISIGDVNGIGIEVVLKTFSDERMLNICTPIVYGSSKAMSYHKNALNLDDVQYNVISGPEKARSRALNVLNCWTDEVKITIGNPDKATGAFALKALEAVNYDVSQGKIDAIITAPINKKHLSTKEHPFTGQTEFFTKRQSADESLMFLLSENLKVGLVTNHVPVKNIVQNISVDGILSKLRIMNNSLKKDFLIPVPRIAVLAVNPHAGDEGIIGNEDAEIVMPAVKKAKDDKIMVFGPYAADGFFGSGAYRSFDGILGMYHDQGLIPFKALTFGHGVNYTAGLPIVRTSPDHGTAYDIAGKGIASEESFRQAVYTAVDILQSRERYTDMNAYEMKKGRKDHVPREDSRA